MKTAALRVRFVFRLILPLLLFSGITHSRAAGNLIANPDFGLGNSFFSSDYYFTPSDLVSETTYVVGDNPRNYHANAASFGDHTTGSGQMLILNGATNANVVAWRQSISITPGQRYTFGAWSASWGRTPPDWLPFDTSPALLRLFVNGNQAGSDFALSAADGGWSLFTAEWQAGPTDTSAVLTLIDINTTAYGNDFTLDDLTFQAIPEPSAKYLLLSSLLIFFLAKLLSKRVRPFGPGTAPLKPAGPNEQLRPAKSTFAHPCLDVCAFCRSSASTSAR